jgi:uncharacterized protein
MLIKIYHPLHEMEVMQLNLVTRIALVLVIIGAINCGLVGLFNYDLVAGIFGNGSQAAAFPRIIYSLVGLAGLVSISALFLERKEVEQASTNKA